MEDNGPPQIITARLKDLPWTPLPARHSTCAFCFEAVWLGERLLEELGSDVVPVCIQCTQELIDPTDEIRGLAESQREELAGITGETEEQLDDQLSEMERLLRAGRFPFNKQEDPP